MHRTTPSPRALDEAAADTGPALGVVQAVPAALLCAVLVLAYAVADATLLFGASFPERVSTGLGMALVGSAVVAAIVALGSAMPGTIGGAQEITIVMLATLVADVEASFPAAAGRDAAFATAVAAVLVASSAVGLACLLAARYRLGRFVHYVPWPVVAGLLGGSGLALIAAAVPVLTGGGGLGELISGPVSGADLRSLALGAAAAGAFALAARHRAPGLALVATIALGYAAWRLAVHGTGLELPAPGAGGWTLASAAEPVAWPHVPDAVSDVDWWRVAQRLPFIGALVAITLVATLVKVGAVGQLLDRDVDESRELRAVGAAHLGAAGALALPGFHSLSLTQIARRMGAARRTTALLLALLTLLALPFAGSILAHAPRFLVGGMLLWVGGDLAASWLFGAREALSRLELGIVVLVATSIVGLGFLPGVLVGLGATLVLFALDYGRIDALRAAVPDPDLRSNADRTATERALLGSHAHELLVLRLQGYLFFGTAHRLVEQLRERLGGPGAASGPRHVVVDLGQVTGLDASALRALERLCALVRRRGLELVFSGVPPRKRGALEALLSARAGAERVPVFDDLDGALQAREERLLEALPGFERSDRARLVSAIGQDGMLRLTRYADTVHVDADQTLLRAGRPAGALYLVREGRLAVRLPGPGREVRVRDVGPGALLGELSFYLERPASADIVARTRCRLWRITGGALERMLDEDPVLASRFHRHVAATLAERLVDNGRQIRMLAS